MLVHRNLRFSPLKKAVATLISAFPCKQVASLDIDRMTIWVGHPHPIMMNGGMGSVKQHILWMCCSQSEQGGLLCKRRSPNTWGKVKIAFKIIFFPQKKLILERKHKTVWLRWKTRKRPSATKPNVQGAHVLTVEGFWRNYSPNRAVC